MKLRAWWAIARGTILESVRRKDLWVVAILGGLIVGGAGIMGLFGIDGLQVFAKDLTATVLGLFSAILAIMTTSRQIPEEIKNRTLYPMLARPISRFDFLMGKYIGSVIATWVGFLALSALAAVALLIFRVQFDALLAQYVVAKMMGLALLCAISLCLSCYMTPQATATLSLVVAFGVAPISRALVIGFAGMSPVGQMIAKFFNAALPQLTLFDLGARAANLGWKPVPAWAMFALLGYGLAYGAMMLALGWFRFNRRSV